HPRVEHILRRHPSPAQSGCARSHGPLYSTPRREHREAGRVLNALAGARCVHFQEPRPVALRSRGSYAGLTTQKALPVRLSRNWIAPRMFRATVYEISRLESNMRLPLMREDERIAERRMRSAGGAHALVVEVAIEEQRRTPPAIAPRALPVRAF